MEFWFSWLELGILFLVLEIFFFTYTFLAIGLSSFLVGLVVFYFNISIGQWWLAAVIFFLLSGFFVILNKKFFYGKKCFHNDKYDFIGEKLIVKLKAGEKFVYHNGYYWKIYFEIDDINPGDTVEILDYENDGLRVKKIF